MTIRVGVSGWLYPGWRGVFYPPGLRHKDELPYAAARFPTIEINGTHYSLKRPHSFQEWYDATPPGFVLAVKGSRFITHMKRLKDLDTALPNFFAQGLLLLREKLGPLLWQLGPHFALDEERVDAFLAALPRDTAAALELARRHDHRLEGRAHLEIDESRPLRHALEVRHESFACARFAELCRRRDVALVVSDAPGHPYAEDVTSSFVYVRLHGSQERYVSRYSDAELDRWARRISTWSRGGEPEDAHRWGAQAPVAERRDVYVYLDNDFKAHAPEDARRLMARLFGPATLDEADRTPPHSPAAHG